MKATTMKTEVRSILAGNHVKIETTPVVVGKNTSIAAPQVALVREGTKVAAIEIRCGCGEVIVLDCDYAPNETVA